MTTWTLNWESSTVVANLAARGIGTRYTVHGEPRLYTDAMRLIDPVDIFWIKDIDRDGTVVFNTMNQLCWPQINMLSAELGTPRVVKFRDFTTVIPEGAIAYLLRNYGETAFSMGTVSHLHSFKHRYHTPISFLLDQTDPYLKQSDIENAPVALAWQKV
jgi:hypothetical protein